MFGQKKILAITMLFVTFCLNLTACNNTANDPNNIDKIAKISEKNNNETDKDETRNNNITNDWDFIIKTDYPDGYDGAPIVGVCERDKTGEMSISEMISSLDNTGNSFLPFTLDIVQGLYLKFNFNPDIIPAEIKEVYYINKNSETELHYVDSLMKIPEKIGVYYFFADLKWNDGIEEVIYFRVEVVASLTTAD